MMYYQRSILICKLKNLAHQNSQHLSFVPELCYLQAANFNKIFHTTSARLKQQGKALFNYKKIYGKGIIPMNLTKACAFVEALYRELSDHHIPLPDNVLESELKYTIRHFDRVKQRVILDSRKIQIEKRKLSFFAKYLPFCGTVFTMTLTVGLTLSTVTMLMGWGWSLLFYLFFGGCKYLSNYADIAGGPEKRFQSIGFWIDRKIFGKYGTYHKTSFPRIMLHGIVSIILLTGALLTWYAGWETICRLNKMLVLPDTLATLFAGLFVCSSINANFGRVYSPLYDLLLGYASHYFSFDNVNQQDKLNLNQLSSRLQSLQQSKKIQSNQKAKPRSNPKSDPVEPAKKPLLFHGPQVKAKKIIRGSIITSASRMRLL